MTMDAIIQTWDHPGSSGAARGGRGWLYLLLKNTCYLRGRTIPLFDNFFPRRFAKTCNASGEVVGFFNQIISREFAQVFLLSVRKAVDGAVALIKRGSQ